MKINSTFRELPSGSFWFQVMPALKQARHLAMLLCVCLMLAGSWTRAAADTTVAASAAAYPAAPRYTDVIALTFTVTGGAQSPTGNVTYSVDAGTMQTAALAGGASRVNLGMLTPGSHHVDYKYAGDGSYPATASQTLTLAVADLPFTLSGALRLVSGAQDFGFYSAFDKAGNLFTTETNNNLITAYDTAGNLTTIPSTGLSAPRGIVFDLSGNFYVADAANNRIVKFTLGAAGFDQSTLSIAGLSNPTTLAINAAAGLLYIADKNNNRIVTYNLATQVLTPVATNGNLASLAVDAAGNLYYSQFGSYQHGYVFKLDPQGNTTDLFYPDSSPSGLALDAAGNLYVSDTSTNQLSRYDRQGHFVQVGSINSASIAIDARGRLFFPQGNSLFTFVPGPSAQFGDISAGYLFNYGSTPNSSLSYQLPYNTSIASLTIPAAGTGFSTLNATCSGSYCDATLTFDPIYPGRGTGYAHATLNTGAALDTLLYGTGYNPELAFSPGVQSAQTPGLTAPAGLTLDTLRTPYVSDSGANKVFKVPATGSATAIPFTGLSKPTQIAVDGAFSVYVLDSGNNRIVKVDLAGNQTVPFQLSQQTALTSLASFFVDGAGTLFLGGSTSTAAAIYSLDLSGNYNAVLSGIALPTVLLVDGFGNIFSGEASTGILRKFDTLGRNTVIATNLPGIASLTQEPSGVFDITQTGVATVTAVQLDGTVSVVPVNGLTLPVATAVSPTADLYVVDAATLRLTEVVRSQSVPFVFGSVPVGSTKTIMQSLFNAGNRAITFNDALPGNQDFVAGTANQCMPPSLAVGASCNFAFTFTPTQVQDYNATGYIDTNTGGANYIFTNYVVQYSGSGTAAAVTAVLTPANVDFGNVSLGATSPSQVLTLSNTGGGTLTISSVVLSGSSAVTQRSTTCAGTLSAGASCTFTLVFTPTSRAAVSATLTVTDNSSTGTTQTAAIIGTGVAPLLSISPTTVSFPDTQTGSASPAQTLTVTNNGNAVANFSSISLGGVDPSAFTLSKGCGATLAANASCTLAVTFVPNAARAFSATVAVASDDPASPATANLAGKGLAAGKLSILPVSQIFPSTNVGASSAAQSSTISNATAQAIYLSAGSLSDVNDFTQSNNCTGLLVAGNTCTVTFTFTPRSTGALTSTYTIFDLNHPEAPLSVALGGSGTPAPVPQAVLTPSALTFTTVPNTQAPSQTLTLSNPGTGLLNIASILLGGTNASSFAIAGNGCGTTLNAGAACTLTIGCTAVATGTYTATLNVADNATPATQSAALSCTVAGTPQAALAPATVSYGNVNVGAKSAASTITLTNAGSATLAISSISLQGTNAASFNLASNSCGATLSAGASCAVTVSFAPTAAGNASAVLAVTDALGTQSSSLSGTGLIITPPDFTITATPSAQATYRGQSVTYSIALASLSGTNPFTGPAVLTASGLPSGTSATFSPTAVVPGGSTTFTVSVPPLAEANTTAERSSVAFAALLAGMVLTRRRRIVPRLLLMLLALVSASALSGCGTGIGFAIPSSTSVITITGTSGATVHSTTVTLTVK